MKRDDDGSRTERRHRLVTVANPAPWHDARVRWSGDLAEGRRLILEYVPDRLVLAPTAFADYLQVLEAAPWPTLEALVMTVLDDLNNQLVPRWVRVSARQERGPIGHHATASDRQPGWDNPELLAGPG
ncbi:MAG: hypothetical protein WCO00_17355 [Rhodospirillaceae bacterium]